MNNLNNLNALPFMLSELVQRDASKPVNSRILPYTEQKGDMFVVIEVENSVRPLRAVSLQETRWACLEDWKESGPDAAFYPGDASGMDVLHCAYMDLASEIKSGKWAAYFTTPVQYRGTIQ